MNRATHLPAGAMVFAPVQLAEKFPHHKLVARSDDPCSFQDHLDGNDIKRVEYLQLTNLDADPSPLFEWESVLPIDLVMKKPGQEFPRLYSFVPLLDRRPVRVSIPVAEGAEKAVKLAASLRFSVKIMSGQPGAGDVKILIRLADFYLKNPTIEVPIEFFHTLFFAMVNDTPTNLWEILEKDPSRFCLISDSGQIASDSCQLPIPETYLGMTAERSEKNHDPQSQTIMDRCRSCPDCTYFQWCRGFFKYPAADYSCMTVFPLFEYLFSAADELGQDMSASIPGGRS